MLVGDDMHSIRTLRHSVAAMLDSVVEVEAYHLIKSDTRKPVGKERIS